MGEVRELAGAPETYALLIAAWYAVLLSLGVATLPAWAHVVAAVGFLGLLAGAGWAAARLDRRGIAQTVVFLGAGFVSSAAVISLVTATTDLSVRELMETTVLGRTLVALVGACLFVGVVVTAVTGARAVVRRTY